MGNTHSNDSLIVRSLEFIILIKTIFFNEGKSIRRQVWKTLERLYTSVDTTTIVVF